MRERPILFSGPMILALLSGAKTQTRRIVQWPVLGKSDGRKRRVFTPDSLEFERAALTALCPYGRVGHRLWVRETFYCDDCFAGDHVASCVGCVRCDHTDADRIEEWRKHLYYRADGDPRWEEGGETPWKPSIHMPRWASRITLEVTGVRVERVQDISEEDAKAEGIRELPLQEGMPGAWFGDPAGKHDRTARESFQRLWRSINGAESWDANPWVWAISFRRVTP